MGVNEDRGATGDGDKALPQAKIATWLVPTGLMFAVVIYLFVLPNLRPRAPLLPPGAHTPGALSGGPIDGIRCEAPTTGYHVHAHLAIFDRGRSIPIPAGVGIDDNIGCLYWVHTHDTSGVIHIEAPHTFRPTLGNFFDIWGQQLTRRRAAGAEVQGTDAARIYVNLKPYAGDPRHISLRAHTLVTIELGPPYRRPQRYNFGDL